MLHEKVQWKKKVERPPIVIDLFCEKGKNIIDNRHLSNILLCVHFLYFQLGSMHTFNTRSGNISPFRAQSHLDFIPSARCPFPQSRFCIIPLRSERLKCSNPSSTFRQPCLTHNGVMVPELQRPDGVNAHLFNSLHNGHTNLSLTACVIMTCSWYDLMEYTIKVAKWIKNLDCDSVSLFRPFF